MANDHDLFALQLVLKEHSSYPVSCELTVAQNGYRTKQNVERLHGAVGGGEIVRPYRRSMNSPCVGQAARDAKKENS